MKLYLGNFFNHDDNITVQIDAESISVILNLKDNLSDVREKLKRNSIINMNGTLSFAIKNSGTNNLAEIAREDEDEKILIDIIEENGKILYLKKNSKPDWKFLNEKCKLEHGRTIASDGIKIANKRAFIMKDCDMSEIGSEGCRKGEIEFNSVEERMIKTEISFTGNICVQDFAKLGCSIGRSKNENSKSETNSFCKFMEFSKASLKFRKYLEPTPEFLKAVEDAIESKNHRKFEEITEEYGRFIPDEVILGGRAYFEGVKNTKEFSEENDSKSTINSGSSTSNIGMGCSSRYGNGNTNYSKLECFKLLGGQQPDSLEDFDDKAWVKSLKDFGTWDCIKFQNPINNFQLLSEDLQKQIFPLFGKKILYSNIKDYKYHLEEVGKPIVSDELNIPSNISKIIRNKNADCNFFATVIDTEEKEFKKRKCKLQIGWMILGYDINFSFIHSELNVQLKVLRNEFITSSNTQSMDSKALLNFDFNSLITRDLCFGIPVLSKLDSSNESLVIGHHFFNVQDNQRIGTYTFSYCLKHNHYVNLPDFTFYALIISNYPSSNNYGLSSFKERNLPEYIKSINSKFLKPTKPTKPKYISLHSTGENHCGPIFLKQKLDKIKIKFIDDRCNQSTCICGNEKLKDLKYAFFDPIQDNIMI